MDQSPQETVLMLIAFSLVALLIGATWHGVLGVVLFVAGFALGWVTHRHQARRRRSGTS